MQKHPAQTVENPLNRISPSGPTCTDPLVPRNRSSAPLPAETAAAAAAAATSVSAAARSKPSALEAASSQAAAVGLLGPAMAWWTGVQPSASRTRSAAAPPRASSRCAHGQCSMQTARTSGVSPVCRNRRGSQPNICKAQPTFNLTALQVCEGSTDCLWDTGV